MQVCNRAQARTGAGEGVQHALAGVAAGVAAVQRVIAAGPRQPCEGF